MNLRELPALNPKMKKGTKTLLWVLGGAAAVGGVGYWLYTRQAGGTSPTPSGATWKRAVQPGQPDPTLFSIPPGARARISIDQNALDAWAGVPAPGNAGVTEFQAALQALPASNIQIGAAGVPAAGNDWPADDPGALTNYHADFTYTGAAPQVLQSAFGTLVVWTQQ